MELLDRSSDPGPTRPVLYGMRDGGESRVWPARAQLFRDSREPRRKQECLDSMVPHRHRMGEVETHARVAFRRAAHVAEDDERTGTHTPRASRKLHYLAPRAETVGHRAPQIDAWSPAAHPPPCTTVTGIPL